MKKKIDVGCGVIHHHGKILISQRLEDSQLGGYWEFPGGKREKGETISQCLAREIDEELGISVRPTKVIRITEHDDVNRILILHFVLCEYLSGEPKTKECMDFKWIKPEELREHQFPPADEDLISELIIKRGEFFN